MKNRKKKRKKLKIIRDKKKHYKPRKKEGVNGSERLTYQV